MAEWTYKDTLQDGYRRPYVAQPSLRDVGVAPTDLSRPVYRWPKGQISTEIMTPTRNKAGKWTPTPTMGKEIPGWVDKPSVQQLKNFNTFNDATKYIEQRHPRLDDVFRMYNDMLNY